MMIKVCILLISSLTSMMDAVVIPAMPLFSSVFSAEPKILIALIISMPPLTLALGAPLQGYLIDRFGSRVILLISLILYLIGSTTALYLHSIILIICGRALMGFAAAGIVTSVVKIISVELKENEKEKYLGLQNTAVALGAIIFLIFSEFLKDINWRMPFVIYIMVIPMFLLCLKYIPAYSIDKFDKNEKKIIQAEKIPYIQIIAVYILSFLAIFFFYQIIVWTPYYVQIKGTDGFQIRPGIILAAFSLTIAFSSYLFGYLRRKLSVFNLYILIFCGSGIGYFFIFNSQSHIFILLSIMFTGLFYGTITPNGASRIVSIVPQNVRGRFLGGLNTCIFLGLFSGPTLTTVIKENYSIDFIFIGTGIISLVTGLLCLILLKSGFPEKL